MLRPKLIGRNAYTLLEQSGEMCRILKAWFQSDLAHGLVQEFEIASLHHSAVDYCQRFYDRQFITRETAHETGRSFNLRIKRK